MEPHIAKALYGLVWTLQAARRKIANRQDTPWLAFVMGVHRRDKQWKFWLPNSCTIAPEQWLFAQP
jgi:hypothetical protein